MPINESMLANELNFWLEIMREHAMFLRLALPPTETQLIQTATNFERRYTDLLERVKREPANVNMLGQEALNLTLEFIQFKTLLLDRTIECRLILNNVFPLQVDHLRREAIHFAMNLVRYLHNEPAIPAADLLHDEVFWLRIMADHAKFIKHLLDPSERRLIMTGQAFSDTFDLLRCQAEDLESILSITPRPVPVLIRFAQETIQAGREIRDFKALAARQLAQCSVLALSTPLLLDHLRREAERFIFEVERDLAAFSTPSGPAVPSHGPVSPIPNPKPSPGVMPGPGLSPIPGPVLIPNPAPAPGPGLIPSAPSCPPYQESNPFNEQPLPLMPLPLEPIMGPLPMAPIFIPQPPEDMSPPGCHENTAGPGLEPTSTEIVIESPLQEELTTTPEPLIYPQTGFVQPQRTQIKIRFVK